MSDLVGALDISRRLARLDLAHRGRVNSAHTCDIGLSQANLPAAVAYCLAEGVAESQYPVHGRDDMTVRNVRQAHIAENLKELRKRQGLRQQDVAEAIGLSVSQYTRIELGKKRLYVDVLLAIAGALSADPADILRPRPVNEREMRALKAVRMGGTAGGIELLAIAQELLADA